MHSLSHDSESDIQNPDGMACAIALCAKALKVFPSPRLPVTCKGSALLCDCLASMAACVGNLRDCGLRSANRSHNRCSMHSVHTRDLRPDQQIRTDALRYKTAADILTTTKS